MENFKGQDLQPDCRVEGGSWGEVRRISEQIMPEITTHAPEHIHSPRKKPRDIGLIREVIYLLYPLILFTLTLLLGKTITLTIG